MTVPPAEAGARGAVPGGTWPPGGDGEFAAIVAAVTAAFGDPTRRDIFLFVRSGGDVTASAVAASFGLHPNVARHHLDKLAAGGYLEVFVDRPSPVGAGRPSKRYRIPSGQKHRDPFSGSRNDLLVMLLSRALGAMAPDRAECLAEEVGEEYGRGLASQMSPGEGGRSLRSALAAVADALTAHGFAAHVEAAGSDLGVVAENCPFGDLPATNPVICAVDRGIVRGMLSGLSGRARPVTVSSRARGDAVCATRV
ncbi:MAG: helix-turn-helix transcriptional regulator [Acidimicrobiales bacterium]